MKRFTLVAGAAATVITGSVLAAPSAFASPTLPNGFTAKVVAHSWQTIRGTVNAAGYDLGIYIGPGVHDVRVIGAHVTGARDEGILVQDTHDVAIEDSYVAGNALSHLPQLQEVKAISLTGTRDVVVSGNTVTGNGDGGIGIYDDGPNSSSTNAPVSIDKHPVPSFGNFVYSNTIKDNLNGCGIVVSAKNPGGGVHNNVTAYNTVLGFDPGHDSTPALGGIVVAGGSFGAVSVDSNLVMGNTVVGGFIPGISLHASAPGQVTRTVLLDNKLARNGGAQDASGKPEGIELASRTSSIDGTQVIGDRVSNDYYGVFHVGDTHTDIDQLSTSGVTVPVGP